MKLQELTFTAVLIFCLCTSLALAEVPGTINFQGNLTDSSGAPETGIFSMEFLIYADSTGGSSLWNETHSSVEVIDGLFRVYLGSVTSFPDTVFDGSVRWLETEVESETLSPREKLVTVPYGFKSKTTDTAAWADSAGHALWADTATAALWVSDITRVDTADYALTADSALHAVYSDTADYALQADSAGHAATSDTAAYAASAPPDNDWTTSGDSLYNLSKNIGIGTASPDKRLTIKSTSQTNDACIRLDAQWNPEIFMDKGGYDADSKIHFQSQGTDHWTLYHDGSEDALKFNHLTLGNMLTLSGDSNAVGIGTTTPDEKLDINGTVQMTGFKMSVGSGDGKVLTSDASGIGTWQLAAGNIDGQGNANYLTKFTDTAEIGNSIIYETSDSIGIGTTTPGAKLDVNGNIKITGFTMPTGAGNGKVLTSNASGIASWANTVGGSGTVNYVPLFTGTQTLSNSAIRQSGSNVYIGGVSTSHKLAIANSTADDVLRLIGPDVYGSGARLNLGDSDYVYFDEDADDHLTVYAVDGTAIMGGSVGIGITSPALGAELHVDGDILSNSISTGLGWTEVHLMNQNVRTSDSPTFATINTGLGAHELYAMNQNVRTSDSPTFATINTGYGANELYAMNQNVTTTSMPTFARVYITDYGYALGGFHVGGTSDPGADNLYVDGYVGIGAAPTTSYRLNTNGGISATTLNTGNGNNELYAMNQNVRTTDAVSFGTINTGPGATEVYNMNQNVRTSDNVRFNQLSVGTTFTTHKITVANTTDEYVLRLMGPDGGGLYYGARLNFGDADYVYLDEDTDDHLLVHGNSGIMLGGAYVSVDNMSGTTGGNLVRWYNDRLYYDSSSKRYKRDIQPLEDNFEKILDVEPKSFIDRASGERNIGFIAEELADLGLGNLVIERDGRPDAIKYQLISVYLLEMIKEVKKENQELREAVEELRTAIN